MYLKVIKKSFFQKQNLRAILTKNYDTDKKLMPSYLDKYEQFFQHLINKKINLFELGVYKGGSLLMWRDYFKKGKIVGLDINNVVIEDKIDRIKFYQGSQSDIKLLSKIAFENAPDGFDIIIDDCSHIGELTKISFWHLFDNHLKAGGVYVIEDWGTGYWDSWPDGGQYISNHNYGMVGLIKELVDECGMEDITHEKFGIFPHRKSKIERMQISNGIVFIVKAKD